MTNQKRLESNLVSLQLLRGKYVEYVRKMRSKDASVFVVMHYGKQIEIIKDEIAEVKERIAKYERLVK